jgi:DNA replication protein DnaC
LFSVSACERKKEPERTATAPAEKGSISRRDERGPMILTRNQSFGSWGGVFGDHIIATAILHHAVTLNIRGNSYRLKDKLKAGLVPPAEAPE